MGDPGSRREQVLDTAMTVLAEQGVHRLTHRRVDDAAGVARGSVSNYFPTRQALVTATMRHVARWVGELHRPGDTDLDAEQAVYELFRQQVERGMTDLRTPLLAWNRVVFESPTMPWIDDVVAETRADGIAAYSGLLRRCGSTDPERHAHLVMSYVKGVHARQYIVPEPDFDAEAALRPLLDRLLRRPDGAKRQAAHG